MGNCLVGGVILAVVASSDGVAPCTKGFCHPGNGFRVFLGEVGGVCWVCVDVMEPDIFPGWLDDELEFAINPDALSVLIEVRRFEPASFFLPEHEPEWCGSFLHPSLNQWQQADAVQHGLVGESNTGDLKEGWIDVHMSGHDFGGDMVFDPGRPFQKALSPAADRSFSFATWILRFRSDPAVVAGEPDQGVFRKTEFLECRTQVSHGGVESGYLPPVVLFFGGLVLVEFLEFWGRLMRIVRRAEADVGKKKERWLVPR